MPFNKGDFTQQGVAGHVNANLRLNEKRLVNIDLTSNEEAEGCTITGTVKDLLNDKVYNIGSAPSGNIEITENGENINVAPYATATVNVSGGGTSLYHASGTLTNRTSSPIQYCIPFLSTMEREGESYSYIGMTSGTIFIDDDPLPIETNIPICDNMTLAIHFELVAGVQIDASNEVNCSVNIDGNDVMVTITDDNASFDLTVIASNNV